MYQKKQIWQKQQQEHLFPQQTQYVNTTKKGIYLHGIKKAYFSKQKNKYHPNHECLKINSGMFLPQINMWDPLWDFETKYGTINLWKLASNKQKQETLQKTDSIIHKTTGKNDIFLKKYKFY